MMYPLVVSPKDITDLVLTDKRRSAETTFKDIWRDDYLYQDGDDQIYTFSDYVRTHHAKTAIREKKSLAELTTLLSLTPETQADITKAFFRYLAVGHESLASTLYDTVHQSCITQDAISTVQRIFNIELAEKTPHRPPTSEDLTLVSEEPIGLQHAEPLSLVLLKKTVDGSVIVHIDNGIVGLTDGRYFTVGKSGLRGYRRGDPPLMSISANYRYSLSSNGEISVKLTSGKIVFHNPIATELFQRKLHLYASRVTHPINEALLFHKRSVEEVNALRDLMDMLFRAQPPEAIVNFVATQWKCITDQAKLLATDSLCEIRDELDGLATAANSCLDQKLSPKKCADSPAIFIRAAQRSLKNFQRHLLQKEEPLYAALKKSINATLELTDSCAPLTSDPANEMYDTKSELSVNSLPDSDSPLEDDFSREVTSNPISQMIPSASDPTKPPKSDEETKMQSAGLFIQRHTLGRSRLVRSSLPDRFFALFHHRDSVQNLSAPSVSELHPSTPP